MPIEWLRPPSNVAAHVATEHAREGVGAAGMRARGVGHAVRADDHPVRGEGMPDSSLFHVVDDHGASLSPDLRSSLISATLVLCWRRPVIRPIVLLLAPTLIYVTLGVLRRVLF